MKLQQKLVLGALGFSLLIGIVGYVSVHKSQESLEKAIGKGSTILAHETLDKLDRDIYYRIEQLRILLYNPKIQETVVESNQEFDQMPDRQAFILRTDEKWVSGPQEDAAPLIQQLSENEGSRALQEVSALYGRNHGHVVFGEIFVTNKYGANAAQTGKTTDYRQDDEEWWQAAKEEGLYVRDVRFDESSGIHSIDIGLRIEDGKGDFVGVMKAVLDVRDIIRVIDKVKETSEYASTNIGLLSGDGRVIYTTRKDADFDAASWILGEFREKEEHIYYSVVTPPGDARKLIVHAHSRGHEDYKGLGWFLVIEYDYDEIFAPVETLGNILLTVSLGVMIGAIVAGFLFSQTLAIPIVKLVEAAHQISAGELNVEVDVRSKDEMGVLAKTFNEMAGHLKVQNGKVERKTAELTALYEVSNAIPYAVDYEQLLKLVMESVFKIVDCDICGALLRDAEMTNLVIRPSYLQSVGYVDEIKSALREAFLRFCDEPAGISCEEIKVIPVDPGLQVPQTREFGELKSSFNAPILVGGEVIGVFNFSSVQEEIFSAEEVKFIYTVINQVSNAIEHLQAMIRAEKSKIESMVESMLEGVIMLDNQGHVAVLNLQARDMLGLDPHGEITSSMLYAKMRLANLDDALEQVRQKKDVVMHETVLPHDTQRILKCTLSPVGKEENRVGTTIILRDVTREKEIDAMKTEFISTVSHELRTPLSITKEGLNLILDRVAGEITQKQEMILSAAKENMDRLARLINNVLDVSKIEAGKMEAKKERLNIAELAEEVMATFEMKAKEKNLDLRVRFSDREIGVFADRDKMIQVFTNLINNALKFTPEGVIEISGAIQGDFVECVVADTGIGISKKDLERVFVKFQQFGRAPGSGEKGTGLGLTIAKGIVEMHDGRMWVESALGKGTKFIFTLPKYSPKLPLKEFVENGIKEAQRSNARMSLLAMTMEGIKDNGNVFPENKRLEFLENLENVLKEETHRQGDAVFRDDTGCFVTLANCSKDHLQSVHGRFAKALESYLVREQLKDKVVLKMGAATYPGDARSGMELLKKATEM